MKNIFITILLTSTYSLCVAQSNYEYMILGHISEKNGKLAYSIHKVPVYDEHNLAKLEEQHIVTDSLTQVVQDVIIEWQKRVGNCLILRKIISGFISENLKSNFN